MKKLEKLIKQRKDEIESFVQFLELNEYVIKDKIYERLEIILQLNQKINREEDLIIFSRIAEGFKPTNKKLLNRYTESTINTDNYLTLKFDGNVEHPTKEQKSDEQGIVWVDNKTGKKVKK